jgi:hypothetical protein
MKLQGIKYYFRIHTGPDAEARAAVDYSAMVAHRDEVAQQLDGIWDREMKRRHVKEYLGRLVGAKSHPHSPPPPSSSSSSSSSSCSPSSTFPHPLNVGDVDVDVGADTDADADQCERMGAERDGHGFRSSFAVQGTTYYLRKHYGPDAEEKAAAHHYAIAPHRDTLIKALEGIEGVEEKNRWLKEYWGGLVGMDVPSPSGASAPSVVAPSDDEQPDSVDV